MNQEKEGKNKRESVQPASIAGCHYGAGPPLLSE